MIENLDGYKIIPPGCPITVVDARSPDYISQEAARALLDACKLYLSLDNDSRSGCAIADKDWAECHQAATEAIALAVKQGTPNGS